MAADKEIQDSKHLGDLLGKIQLPFSRSPEQLLARLAEWRAENERLDAQLDILMADAAKRNGQIH